MSVSDDEMIARRIRRAGDAYAVIRFDEPRLRVKIGERTKRRRLCRTGVDVLVAGIAVIALTALVVAIPSHGRGQRLDVAAGPGAKPSVLFRPVWCLLPAYSAEVKPGRTLSGYGCVYTEPASHPTTPAGQAHRTGPVIRAATPRLGTGAQRWLLGPADLTGSSVASATVIHRKGRSEIRVTFNPSSQDTFEDLAASRWQDYTLYELTCRTHKAPPETCARNHELQAEEVIEINGVVVTSVLFNANPAHRQFVLTGPFTAAQAVTLARQFNESRS